MPNPEFITIEYPAVRQFTADIGRLSREKHHIRALLEVDVTDALARIKTLRQSGQKISFLAWFLKVLADTVADHPPVNGIQKRHHRIVVFNSIDISTIIEKQVQGTPVPLPLILRSVNQRNLDQINDELQAVTEKTISSSGDLDLGQGDNRLLIRLGLLMPQWLRLFVFRNFILGVPARMQKTMGTVMVTSLGTVGRVSAFILPTSIHPLSIGIGTLNRKPTLFKGEVHPRQILHLTVTLDHDVIDGMPARRFVDDLVTRLTRADALEINL